MAGRCHASLPQRRPPTPILDKYIQAVGGLNAWRPQQLCGKGTSVGSEGSGGGGDVEIVAKGSG